MTSFHLTYPRKRGYFYWDELGVFARALGFMEKSFLSRIPSEHFTQDPNGITLQDFLYLLNIQKMFNIVVDRTFNIHTDEWNLMVIRRAIQLLEQHVLTFEQIHRIRLAFQVYENADTKGLPLEEKHLLRTLKMCDRMISPMKMMQRIKHMKANFEEEDRIQLHEFFDLILWCEIYENYLVKDPGLNTAKNEKDLYEIHNFETLLCHHDMLIANRLNEKYIKEELTFTKEKHVSKKMPKDIPPVDPEVRKRMVYYHSENYKFLQAEVVDSQRKVYLAKSGHVRSRPITAPDLIIYQPVEPSVRVSTVNADPKTLVENLADLLRPFNKGRASVDFLSVPRPDIPKYERTKSMIAVKPEEKEEHVHRIEALGFDTATLDVKYLKKYEESTDALLPGYRENMISQHHTPAVSTPITPVPVVKRREPDFEALHNMVYHKFKGPRPIHGKSCDARYRGWHKVRVRRGAHYVLAAPAFDVRNAKGSLFDKQINSLFDMSKRDKYVFRQTNTSQISSDKPKSRANGYSRALGREKTLGDVSVITQDSAGISISASDGKSSELKVDKGSSEVSKNTSSDVSWKHLKVYTNNPTATKLKEDIPKKKKHNLEGITEESGRKTRVSHTTADDKRSGLEENTDKGMNGKNIGLGKKQHSQSPSRTMNGLVDDKQKSKRDCTQLTGSGISQHSDLSKEFRKSRKLSFIRLAERVDGIATPQTLQRLLAATAVEG